MTEGFIALRKKELDRLPIIRAKEQRGLLQEPTCRWKIRQSATSFNRSFNPHKDKEAFLIWFDSLMGVGRIFTKYRSFLNSPEIDQFGFR